jgi:hypothetical protein
MLVVFCPHVLCIFQHTQMRWREGLDKDTSWRRGMQHKERELPHTARTSSISAFMRRHVAHRWQGCQYKLRHVGLHRVQMRWMCGAERRERLLLDARSPPFPHPANAHPPLFCWSRGAMVVCVEIRSSGCCSVRVKHTYKMTLETWTGEELRSVWATCARRTGPGSPSTGVSVRSLSRQHLARWTQSPRITWHAAGSSSITLRGQSGTLSDAAFSTSLRIPLTFLSAFAFKSNESALVRNHPSSVDGGVFIKIARSPSGARSPQTKV